uniref:Immunoglobulin V-set domain-containing protein n=2 Tax=Gasterosteus aculeatus TaxID=69293 RepID=G3P1A3_GASAC
MVDHIVLKPLGLVLIVTAQMVFNGPTTVQVTGNLGKNISFPFTFNISVTEKLAVYSTNHTKVAEYLKGTTSSNEGDFHLYPESTIVICHITNLKLHHSQIYWATLFMDSGLAIESNKIQLIVRGGNQHGNRNSTVPPMMNATAEIEGGNHILFPSYIVLVLVVSSVVLLAAVPPFLICCLLRTKDKQTTPQQQSSNATVQETLEASNYAPAPPLVYSVLDFPKRSSAVLELNPSDTEYAAVSYLPEQRRV